MDDVFAVSIEGGRVEACKITRMALNEGTDIAFFSISLQDHAERPYFSHTFTPDGVMPVVGGLVCIFGFAGLKGEAPGWKDGDVPPFQLRRKPLLRVGTVTGHYPKGYRLCRGPCFETTIPVYSGMSGGPAVLWSEGGGAIRPFGIVCSDPDPDDHRKEDRSIAGRSIVAALPFVTDGTGDLGMTLTISDHAGPG